MKELRRIFSACIIAAFPAVAGIAFTGCENYQPKQRDVGALGGAAVGAGLGAIVGNQVGDPGAGVAIGSAAGALVGGLVGNAQDSQQGESERQDELLRRQERELERQRREIEDLKRQGYYDDRLRKYDGNSSSEDRSRLPESSYGSDTSFSADDDSSQVKSGDDSWDASQQEALPSEQGRRGGSGTRGGNDRY